MSKPIQDKKKTNFIIAVGYCLVVSVILVNYLCKTPSRRNTYREGTRPVHPGASSDKAVTGDLESQLLETKRMNREMREMLVDIQNSSASKTSSRVLSHKTAGKSGNTSLDTSLKPIPVIDMKSMTLPELNPKIDQKFKTFASCPFIIGRNPFASPVVVTDISTTEEPVTFPGHAVICNPKLPYVFSGSNSNLRIISNY